MGAYDPMSWVAAATNGDRRVLFPCCPLYSTTDRELRSFLKECSNVTIILRDFGGNAGQMWAGLSYHSSSWPVPIISLPVPRGPRGHGSETGRGVSSAG